MPLLIFWGASAILGLGALGYAADRSEKIVKWIVIGGVAYVVYVTVIKR